MQEPVNVANSGTRSKTVKEKLAAAKSVKKTIDWLA